MYDFCSSFRGTVVLCFPSRMKKRSWTLLNDGQGIYLRESGYFRNVSWLFQRRSCGRIVFCLHNQWRFVHKVQPLLFSTAVVIKFSQHSLLPQPPRRENIHTLILTVTNGVGIYSFEVNDSLPQFDLFPKSRSVMYCCWIKEFKVGWYSFLPYFENLYYIFFWIFEILYQHK